MGYLRWCSKPTPFMAYSSCVKGQRPNAQGTQHMAEGIFQAILFGIIAKSREIDLASLWLLSARLPPWAGRGNVLITRFLSPTYRGGIPCYGINKWSALSNGKPF